MTLEKATKATSSVNDGDKEKSNKARMLGVFGVNNGRIIAKKKTTNNSLCMNSFRLSIKKSNWTPGSTICLKCGALYTSMNANYCNDCENTGKDIIKGLPTYITIMYCQRCEGYSFSPSTDFDFVSTPVNSPDTIKFLIKSIYPNLNRLRLALVDAYLLPSGFRSRELKIMLQLEQKTVDGAKIKNRHVVVYQVAYMICRCCSFNCSKPVSRGNHTVHFRRCPSDRRNISRILFGILKHGGIALEKIEKLEANGMDFLCSTKKDATAFYQLLCNQFPIKPEKVYDSYNALVCPLSQEDLVKVRSGSSKCLMICTNVTNSISLLDPFTLLERTVSADEYWNDPTMFKIYKDQWDVVEYIVLSVDDIYKAGVYTMADIVVARVSDYGKNDTVFKARTHIGELLKPWDQAYGYELCGTNNNCKDSNPSVVLVRKGYCSARIQRKKSSPEYEKFLKDMEKNPEAMFKLSLNNENLQLEMSSEKPRESFDFNLEDLLSGLGLDDHQSGNSSS